MVCILGAVAWNKKGDRHRSEVPLYEQKSMRRGADRSGVRTRILCGRCRSAG
jgi:hypothetical protein